MISFTTSKKGNNAVLRWTIASEENNSGFEVQASTDGKTYQKLGFVESRVGTTSRRQEYSFTDSRSNKYGTVYYRLKQIDLNGSSSVHGPSAVNFGEIKAVHLTVLPNPFNDYLWVNVTSPLKAEAVVTIHDLTGKLYLEKVCQVQTGSTSLKLRLGQNLPAGFYVLTVKLNEERTSFKLVKM